MTYCSHQFEWKLLSLSVPPLSNDVCKEFLQLFGLLLILFSDGVDVSEVVQWGCSADKVGPRWK